MICEQWCQLFHFDRSGAQYTSRFSIHEDVIAFIRVVLGVSSFDERTLGFDTAVQWAVEGGRKVSGTIVVTDIADVTTTYSLVELEPVFCRYEILGRATTGWRALSPEGVEVFVKDSWRDGDAEYDTLKLIVGVDGTGQMLSYEAVEVTTSALRANGSETWPKPKDFRERTSTRIVMESYGESIASFKSQKQLLSAIRDAIAGLYFYWPIISSNLTIYQRTVNS